MFRQTFELNSINRSFKVESGYDIEFKIKGIRLLEKNCCIEMPNHF